VVRPRGQLLFGSVTPLVGFIVGRIGNPTDAGLYLTAIIFISLVSLWACRRLGVR
jgi:MHS family proline/betaine transporter-like MFS transporter